MRYKIAVTIANGRQLTFTVSSYDTLPGGFIRFKDERTRRVKIYDGRSCEIEEVTP